MDFRPLTTAEVAYRNSGIAGALTMLNAKGPLPVAGVQAIFDWCRAQNLPADRLHNHRAVVSLGMAYGDVLARELGLVWAWCEDGDLAHLVVRPPDRLVAIWPVFMICRRLLSPEDTTIAGMIGVVRNTIAGLDTGNQSAP